MSLHNCAIMQEVFKALSSEQRIKIVKALMEKKEPLCYCELEGEIGKDRSVLYRHFKKLESAGIIETSKNGRKLEGELKNPKEIKEILKIVEKVSKNEN